MNSKEIILNELYNLGYSDNISLISALLTFSKSNREFANITYDEVRTYIRERRLAENTNAVAIAPTKVYEIKKGTRRSM